MFNIQESARFTITKASPASGIYENLPTLKCCPELTSCAIELIVRFQYIYIFQLFFLGNLQTLYFCQNLKKLALKTGSRKYQRKKVENQKMFKMLSLYMCEAPQKFSTIFWPFLTIFTLFYLKNQLYLQKPDFRNLPETSK